ncbi:MAG: hypothetical protein H6Q51_2773, partial [Deltaproteobacteria bacterium]|nr:hypothetical protein [Deltaproteobacteria bacterium]
VDIIPLWKRGTGAGFPAATAHGQLTRFASNLKARRAESRQRWTTARGLELPVTFCPLPSVLRPPGVCLQLKPLSSNGEAPACEAASRIHRQRPLQRQKRKAKISIKPLISPPPPERPAVSRRSLDQKGVRSYRRSRGQSPQTLGKALSKARPYREHHLNRPRSRRRSPLL